MVLDFRTYENVIVVGDLHSKLPTFVNSITSENTLYILCGDLNLGKDSYESDLESFLNCEYVLAKNNNIICIIRGNHDNPKFFKKNSSFKISLQEEAEHIFLIPDYSIICTANNTILCIGGARSVDRVNRIKDYSFWTGENVNKPSDTFYSSLEDNGIIIDTVISHSAPLFAYPKEFTDEKKYYTSYILNSYSLYDDTLKNDVYKERLLLKGIYEKLNIKNHIKSWIYSHYHIHNEMIYNKTNLISLGIKQEYILK